MKTTESASMTTYILVQHNESVYEFAVTDDRTVLFINFYENGRNFPHRVEIEDVPPEVITGLARKLT